MLELDIVVGGWSKKFIGELTEPELDEVAALMHRCDVDSKTDLLFSHAAADCDRRGES
jgi:succinate dehydrogenase flavin-adding protein (antitoxin of CptAB toxin-antitoxin module)